MYESICSHVRSVITGRMSLSWLTATRVAEIVHHDGAKTVVRWWWRRVWRTSVEEVDVLGGPGVLGRLLRRGRP